jgi:murein DD-endopeptidase MepM/ murein hydrolase activator NlpD
LDLSSSNHTLNQIDFTNTVMFTQYVFGLMNEAGTPLAIGKYNEDRIIYRQSENFQGHEPRSIHLGIDLWAAEGTAIFSPLPGVIHSFNNNVGFGNYGPTLILQHQLEECIFYTLYGHLSTNL